MKWRTIIHVILLVSLTVVKALTQSYWETEEKLSIGQHFSHLQENNCKAIAMIMFVQYMQGGTFGKAVKMAEDITDLVKRCAAANRDNTNCLEPLVSQRHPFLYAPTILSAAIHYDELMNCCRNAEDPTHNLEECFQKQAPKVVKPIKEDSLRQEHTCGILNKFGERTLKALKLAQISQTIPKADFVTVSKLVMDIANMHKDCSCGDMLDCMHDRERILYYVCINQDIISSKIKKSCEKPLLQRSECIVNAENDNKPADLSPGIREFIEDKEIHERFAQEKR